MSDHQPERGGTDDPLDTKAWMAKEQRRREQFYADESAKWFAAATDETTIPDLEFDTPLCSICTRSTTCEDWEFHCETCNVWWPRSGYGSQAERFDEHGNTLPPSERHRRSRQPQEGT